LFSSSYLLAGLPCLDFIGWILAGFWVACPAPDFLSSFFFQLAPGWLLAGLPCPDFLVFVFFQIGWLLAGSWLARPALISWFSFFFSNRMAHGWLLGVDRTPGFWFILELGFQCKTCRVGISAQSCQSVQRVSARGSACGSAVFFRVASFFLGCPGCVLCGSAAVSVMRPV
jgi:hypothetical protein